MGDMTLTLPKADLIKEVEAARKDVWDTHSEEVKTFEDALAKCTSGVLEREDLAKWHDEFAAYLRAGGEINDNGTPTKRAATQAGLRPKPAGAALRAGAMVRYSRRGGGGEYWYDKRTIESSLGRAKQRRDDAVKPYDVQLTLLNKARETEVSIASGDYQRLLSGTFR